MATNLIPPGIIMLAVTSRLLDLHQSRRQKGIYVPDVPETAGDYMGIALLALNALRVTEIERGFSYTSVEEIHSIISLQAKDVSRDDLDFVLESLSKEREICFATPNQNGAFDYGNTRQKTSLVTFAESYAQIKLTENGRMFLRICEDERSWLYDDADAAKIVTALLHFKFYDVPSLCHSLGLELALKGQMLTDYIERPTRKEQCEILIADAKSISQNLRNAQESPGFELGNLQAELETLLKIIESVTRRFVEFLEIAQMHSGVIATSYSFLELADHLVYNYTPSSSEHLELLMANILHPDTNMPWFHPSGIPGQVDLYSLLDGKKARVEKKSFNLDADPTPTVERFSGFIRRYKKQILAMLERGPVSFSQFITSSDFELLPGEALTDFIGAYASPSLLDPDGDDLAVVVGLTDEEFIQKSESATLIASDPVIFLAKQ
ncbi:hypothetical protein GMST_14220 [Geomonas silvestris]|uniref:Uncharacterized protein n=1 Tax=Geomonas silvestris TaxID=2740184 RepID=A0A6V8MGK7_9BACT|nr:hypothetical protein [Geomonas silvestris]GFO59097.1 hypothetical protein GMST_14220 [Geomonas silvestris]